MSQMCKRRTKIEGCKLARSLYLAPSTPETFPLQKSYHIWAPSHRSGYIFLMTRSSLTFSSSSIIFFTSGACSKSGPTNKLSNTKYAYWIFLCTIFINFIWLVEHFPLNARTLGIFFITMKFILIIIMLQKIILAMAFS